MSRDVSKLTINLGRSAVGSAVALNGRDITAMLTGISVDAHVGSLTAVTLHCFCEVELVGETEDLRLEQRRQPSPWRLWLRQSWARFQWRMRRGIEEC